MKLTVEDLIPLFARHDPEGLIDGGGPWDEYAPEAEGVHELVNAAMNEEQVLDALEDVWDAMFHPAKHADRERLAPVAHELWKMRRVGQR